jgi:hypothetical protein
MFQLLNLFASNVHSTFYDAVHSFVDLSLNVPVLSFQIKERKFHTLSRLLYGGLS